MSGMVNSRHNYLGLIRVEWSVPIGHTVLILAKD